MSIDSALVDKLQASLTYHRERHTVLAANIANIDTPSYRPLNLTRRPGSDPKVMSLSNPGHIASSSEPDVTTSFDDGGTMQSADGNAVSLERELAKINANRTRYAATAELVSRRFALLRYAAGNGV